MDRKLGQDFRLSKNNQEFVKTIKNLLTEVVFIFIITRYMEKTKIRISKRLESMQRAVGWCKAADQIFELAFEFFC